MRTRAAALFVVVVAVMFAPSVARAFQGINSRPMAPGVRWFTSSEAPPSKAQLQVEQHDVLAGVFAAAQLPAPAPLEAQRTSPEYPPSIDSPFDASPDPLRGPPSL